MSHIRYEVRAGAYFDSVVLMHLQRELAGLPGVLDAGVVMATPANRELLGASDLLPESVTAGPDDLLLVVKANSDPAALAALGQVDDLLRQRRQTVGSDFRPRRLKTAVQQAPDAHWVLISVPGRYAADVAHEALNLDRHVFLYSDNVSLADEIALKEKGAAQGLVVMGPDCGTAALHGIGLGFANRVRRGPIGLVGASGTGLQAVSAAIHEFGGGVSHALGTGGRDLKAAVGARTARQALALLAQDPNTRVIVIVSKPPDPAVASRLLATAQATGKPVVIYFQGLPATLPRVGHLHFAVNLRQAAALAVSLSRDFATPDRPVARTDGFLRGLFAGGTLAYEAVIGLSLFLPELYANLPAGSVRPLAEPAVSQGHTIVDMGEDTFTQGRLHPMMDNTLRQGRLEREMADPAVGLVALDVVLGLGSHADSAAELAPVIASGIAARPDLIVAVLIVGTDEDPQGMAAQRATFETAGAVTFTDSAQFVAFLALAAAPIGVLPAVRDTALATPFAAINAGLLAFAASLEAQEVPVTALDWRPPAGGKESMTALLTRLRAPGRPEHI